MNVRTEAIQTPIVHEHDLLYTPNHTWARIINDKTVRVGLSKYACKNLIKFSGSKLGIIFVQTERIGTEVIRMQPFGMAETIMTTFDLVSPVSGRIKMVNAIAKIIDDIYLSNNNPEDSWIIEVEPTHLEEETRLLLTPHHYKKFVNIIKDGSMPDKNSEEP